MDNAVKALEMAGGVLIAILILSLFVYMFNQVSYNQAMQNQNEEAKRIEAFNKKYEAYNKNILYGSDVISVINMGINNNSEETAGGEYSKDDPYSIDVSFTLLNDLVLSVEAIDKDGVVIDNIVYEDAPVLEAEESPYKISDEDDLDKIALIMPSENGVVIEYNNRLETTFVAKGAYEEFINRIFRCSGIEYNATTGRVVSISFQEIDTTKELDDDDDIDF